ncbi:MULTISPECIES: response regulator [Bacillales]|uniref:Response regulator n=1 Tax=Lysinibacillus louembei TaxID=1470088 RepID=A0ABZ0RSX1_9BACI|nr:MULTISPECIES: response regulator [Bacillales]MCT6925710.1 response regulator [Metasolibacillus sp.]MCT6941866.1 response regulator [Metasolibacillus sp.]WPK10357.1 response regulator [Lysinibacillus louembei]
MAKILVVDDEEILRMLIRDTLEDMGYEIDEAEDGPSALQKLEEASYDVMLLDYMMPNLTGIEVIDNLPSNVREQLIIIMLTAKSQEADKQRVFEKGVDYFMSKPFSPMKLAELVEEALNAK